MNFESKRNSILNAIGGIPDILMLRMPNFFLEKNDSFRDEYLGYLNFYADIDLNKKNKPFFTIPEDAPPSELISSLSEKGIVHDVYRYPSWYSVRNPALKKQFMSYSENLSGYLHLWRHDDRAGRPLVLCLHGFKMAEPARAYKMFRIGRLLDMGLDVGLCIAPFHWKRKTHFLYQNIVNPNNLPLTMESFAQNIYDLHSAVLMLRKSGYEKIGLIGASLGGYTSALYATVKAPVDFMFIIIPPIDFFSTYLRPRNGGFKFRIDKEVAAKSEAAYRVMSPIEYSPVFDVNKISVVMHTGDRMCRPGPVYRWMEKWKIKNHVEVTGGHWLYFGKNVRGRAWYGCLEDNGFLMK
jgi:hypothetical protein